MSSTVSSTRGSKVFASPSAPRRVERVPTNARCSEMVCSARVSGWKWKVWRGGREEREERRGEDSERNREEKGRGEKNRWGVERLKRK